MNKNVETQGQVIIPSKKLVEEMAYFMELGFKLINIFPDDDPEIAVMVGHNLHIRLDKNAICTPPSISLLTDDPAQFSCKGTEFKTPNGTFLKILPKSYKVPQVKTKHKFEICKLEKNHSWITGRAGMLYRDLLPSRLGGSIMASHIRIPKGRTSTRYGSLPHNWLSVNLLLLRLG
jgi:hypothetical protein